MLTKTTKASKSPPPALAEAKSRRSANRKAKPEHVPAAVRSAAASPHNTKDGASAAAVTALPVQGAIRLDLSNITPAALLVLLKTIKDGLTGNVYYPDFASELALIAGSENGVAALLETLANLEHQRKAYRAALDTEIANAQNNLRSVGLACENHDRTDEALLSVGWLLRRVPGPPQPVAVPARLIAESSRFAGQLNLKWGRVANCRYYEFQIIPMELLIDNTSWDGVPIASWPRTTFVLDTYPSGTMIAIRVRAFGSKGPGPWTESINARVS